MIIQKQKIYITEKIFYILKIVKLENMYHVLYQSQLKFSGDFKSAEAEFIQRLEELKSSNLRSLTNNA
jgi:hypothetical protein